MATAWFVVQNSDNIIRYGPVTEDLATELAASETGLRSQEVDSAVDSDFVNLQRGEVLEPSGTHRRNTTARLITVADLAAQAQEIYRNANPELRWTDDLAITATRKWLYHQAGIIVRVLASNTLTLDQKIIAVRNYGRLTPALVAVWYNVMVRNTGPRGNWSGTALGSGIPAYSDVFGTNGAERVIDGAFVIPAIGTTLIYLPYGEVNPDGTSAPFNPEDFHNAVLNPLNMTPDGRQ